MKLLHLHAHNVFSIGTIDLVLKDRGLLLVTGWSYDENNGNMAGKSSLARNAIMWCMFGKTVDGVRADDVVNTSVKNAKHCGVRLMFEGVDGNTYRIYRARKPNSLVVSVLNPGAVEEEWQDVSKRMDRDTQTLIDKLLGRDHATFIQADFFGQGRERSFLSLPGGEQRAVIEEILPLTSLEQWRVNAKEKLAEAAAKVNDAKIESNFQMKKASEIRIKLEGIRSQQTSWESDAAHHTSTIQARLNKIRGVSMNLKEELLVLRQGIPDALTTGEFLTREENDCRVLETALSSASHKIDNLTGEIDSRSARPDTCTQCSQTLPDEYMEINRVAVENGKERRAVLIRQKGENEARRYAALANVGIAKEAIMVEQRMEEKAEQTTLEELLVVAKETRNPFDVVADAYNAELTKEAGITQVLYDLIDFHVKHRDHLHFWHHAFGTDLKTLMFEKVCPFLEHKANQYLRELNNPQITVSFGIAKAMKSGKTKDEFSVTASTITGSKVFELFSGAEKQLTSFAVGMALADLAALQVEGASKFMILDEPFTNLSPENCENIVNFLTTHKMGDDSTLLLISNEENLASLIQNRIHVVKKNGVTSIE
jgi:DNA repair exonuclease SbcCD ATPase subunit